MHPLPYTVEFSPEIRMDKRIIVDGQAWCGIPTRVYTLWEGYQNRKSKSLKDRKEGKIEIIEEISLDTYLRQRAQEQKVYQYFVPISSGIVIDHIPRGLGLKIRGYISNLFEGENVKHLIEDVNSGKVGGYKDVIVIEKGFLNEQQQIAICSLSPTITINEIRDGHFKKMRIDSPAIVSGIGRCPNQNCITNNDPEAEYKFSSANDGVKCIYCEKHFTPEEVLV